MWRTWHAINTLVGGTAMISEPINKDDVKAVWRNYEIMRPGSREPAQLLTLGNSPHNTTLGFAAERPFGDFAVYNLYNVTEGSQSLSLDFEAAGLPKGVKCAVFDFWANKVLGYATDSYMTTPLEALLLSVVAFYADYVRASDLGRFGFAPLDRRHGNQQYPSLEVFDRDRVERCRRARRFVDVLQSKSPGCRQCRKTAKSTQSKISGIICGR